MAEHAQTIVDRLKGEKDYFHSVAVFTADGALLAATEPAPSETDLKKAAKAYEDRDVAIGEGLDIQDRHYAVSRWYPDRGLVYGRYGGADFKNGENICTYRKGDVIVLFTHRFPYVSSRIIPVCMRIVDEILA